MFAEKVLPNSNKKFSINCLKREDYVVNKLENVVNL